MKVLLVSALLLFASALPAVARIGDSETDLTKRYGKPVRSTGEAIRSLTYAYDGWVITSDFVDGICARVSYAKPGEWTEETFEKLLSTNAGEAEWSDGGSPNLKKLMRTWTRHDGTTANWVVGCLSITSPRYAIAKAKSETEALMAATNT